MKARLIGSEVCTPDGSVVLDCFPVRIGRSRSADIQVDDAWISRVHCEIDEINGALVVRDLHSTHGTYINGLRVTENLLMPGNQLGIGMSSFEVYY
jgi:pSer/pThr/pTyr-binding forkhead associated (FHA) protein